MTKWFNYFHCSTHHSEIKTQQNGKYQQLVNCLIWMIALQWKIHLTKGESYSIAFRIPFKTLKIPSAFFFLWLFLRLLWCVNYMFAGVEYQQRAKKNCELYFDAKQNHCDRQCKANFQSHLPLPTFTLIFLSNPLIHTHFWQYFRRQWFFYRRDLIVKPYSA